MKQLLMMLAVIGAATLNAAAAQGGDSKLEVVAELPQRPTGVAVASDGRVFVSLPFAEYADPEKFIGSVVVLGPGGVPTPFPNAAWNANPATATGVTEQRFLNVQGFTIDAAGRLWALDRGRPKGGPVAPGGAKLVGFDLATGKVVRSIIFPAEIAEGNFLNDVRVDAATETAYATDTANGGVIVINLKSGIARWALRAGTWVTPESREPVVEGVVITDARRAKAPHTADGLALSPDRRWLYLQAHPWVAPILYRVATVVLRDASLTPD